MIVSFLLIYLVSLITLTTGMQQKKKKEENMKKKKEMRHKEVTNS